MKRFTNKDGNAVYLNNKAAAEVMHAWEQYRAGVFNLYIKGRNTRAAYNEENARGQRLVDIQTKHGVWMIHPANATAGVSKDDPRILD
jgi:hypothetical protein